ncbi:hypothetical protein CIHG_07930 [Coccidioides immitis H538.4]|uniref:PNPLA domain-containing protein n=1 Tax=Coccidioides immitis H538.4 TaxID=396776 RepID=A0A0J8RY79_COCIT|nr:hypothetical protein CIHG_07930 [Coccidioides immitis H538.4]
MLGTLGMTIDECIVAYLDLAPKIFPFQGFFFVCATRGIVHTPVLLRSYPSKWEPNTGCTIWQAARATSAAPLYFNGIKFGVPPITYVDGGLHNNNPVRILYEEAMGLINASSGQTIGCIVNTGNGLPPLRDLGMPFLFPFALLILSRILAISRLSFAAADSLL